jgi:hypothetical protein
MIRRTYGLWIRELVTVGLLARTTNRLFNGLLLKWKLELMKNSLNILESGMAKPLMPSS